MISFVLSIAFQPHYLNLINIFLWIVQYASWKDVLRKILTMPVSHINVTLIKKPYMLSSVIPVLQKKPPKHRQVK